MDRTHGFVPHVLFWLNYEATSNGVWSFPSRIIFVKLNFITNHARELKIVNDDWFMGKSYFGNQITKMLMLWVSHVSQFGRATSDPQMKTPNTIRCRLVVRIVNHTWYKCVSCIQIWAQISQRTKSFHSCTSCTLIVCLLDVIYVQWLLTDINGTTHRSTLANGIWRPKWLFHSLDYIVALSVNHTFIHSCKQSISVLVSHLD